MVQKKIVQLLKEWDQIQKHVQRKNNHREDLFSLKMKKIFIIAKGDVKHYFDCTSVEMNILPRKGKFKYFVLLFNHRLKNHLCTENLTVKISHKNFC